MNNKPSVISIILPGNQREFTDAVTHNDRYISKEALQKRCKNMMQAIVQKNLTIEFSNNVAIPTWIESIFVDMERRQDNWLKSTYSEFYALFTCNELNYAIFCMWNATEDERKALRLIAGKGAVPMNEICDILKIKYEEPGQTWYFGTSNNIWFRSNENLVVRDITSRILGYNPKLKKRVHVPDTSHICASSKVILAGNLASDLRIPTIHAISGEEAATDYPEYFSGSDIMDFLPILRSLIISKVIQSSSQGIRSSSLVKVRNKIPMKDLPALSELACNDRLLLATQMAFGVATSPKSKGLLADDNIREFYKEMFAAFSRNPEQFEKIWLSKSVTGLKARYFESTTRMLGVLVTCILLTIKIVYKETGEANWVGMEDFLRSVHINYAFNDGTYFAPYSRDAQTSRPYYPKSDELIPMEDYKARIHDVIVQGIINTLASIGFFELRWKNGTSETGSATKRDRPDNDSVNTSSMCIRLSPYGRYLLGLDEDFPETFTDTNPENDFETDDISRMIFVKNPKSSYIPILEDLTTKFSPTHYLVDEKTLLKGCTDKASLQSRIDRLKKYVIPKPGRQIEKLMENMLAKCDLIRKNPASNRYVLYDISSMGREIYDFITSEEDFKGNVLRVEGGKILVFDSFKTKFFARLCEAGFLAQP